MQNYSSIAQKINANFLCDEGRTKYTIPYCIVSKCMSLTSCPLTLENPLIESDDEQAVASEIERDLGEVSPYTLGMIFRTSHIPHVISSFMTASKTCARVMGDRCQITKKC